MVFLFKLIFLPFRVLWSLISRKRFYATLRDPGKGDGDSFFVISDSGREYHLRLIGIDAPEWSQPYGREASIFRRQLTSDRFFVSILGTDCYGRSLAKVRLSDGTDLARTLVRNGSGYNRGGNGIAELKARFSRSGLWALPRRSRVAPELYRRT